MPRAANKDSMSYLVLRKPETLLYKAKVWDYRFQNVVFSRFFFRNRLMCHDIIILKQTLLRQWVIRKLSLTVRTVGDRGHSPPPSRCSDHATVHYLYLLWFHTNYTRRSHRQQSKIMFISCPRLAQPAAAESPWSSYASPQKHCVNSSSRDATPAATIPAARAILPIFCVSRVDSV